MNMHVCVHAHMCALHAGHLTEDQDKCGAGQVWSRTSVEQDKCAEDQDQCAGRGFARRGAEHISLQVPLSEFPLSEFPLRGYR